MRALFRSKFRVLTLVSLAFMTQCCCIVVPFSIEAQQRQSAPVVQQTAQKQPVFEQIVERIEMVVSFDR